MNIATIVNCFIKSLLYGSSDGTVTNQKILKTDSVGRLEVSIVWGSSCQVYKTAAQSFTDGVAADVIWDAKDFDTTPTSTMWNISDSTHIKVPDNGIYAVSANLGWNSAGGFRGIQIFINDVFKAASYFPAVAGIENSVNLQRNFNLLANDTIKIRGYQSTGGALTVQGLQSRTWFSVTKETSNG